MRLLAATLALLLAAPIAAAPVYLLQRALGPIAVDGRLDEPTWAKAAPASPLRDLSGAPSAYAADIRLAYDDANLYVAARLPAKTLRATLTQRDSVIYRDDDFEVFIDPFARGRDYLELEINQLGTVWDLFLTAPYRDPACLALHDWDIKGLRAAVSLQGTLNQGEGDDQGWTVEIAWPWASITGHSNHPRDGKPPAPGAEPFVHVGSQVKKCETLCVIEAMKVMNEVTAEADGEVVDICVKDGDLVEYGCCLMKIY